MKSRPTRSLQRARGNVCYEKPTHRFQKRSALKRSCLWIPFCTSLLKPSCLRRLPSADASSRRWEFPQTPASCPRNVRAPVHAKPSAKHPDLPGRPCCGHPGFHWHLLRRASTPGSSGSCSLPLVPKGAQCLGLYSSPRGPSLGTDVGVRADVWLPGLGLRAPCRRGRACA